MSRLPKYAALVGAALAGCSASNPGPITTQCSVEGCQVSPALLLAVEVVPTAINTNTAALPAQELSQISVDSKNHFVLTLERATTLDGTVLGDDHNAVAPQPVAAGIVLTRPSRIAGRPPVYYQTSVGKDGSWSLVVSPTHDGELYELRVQPANDTGRPPETFLIDGGRDRTFPLTLTDPAELVQIHGTVTNTLQLPVAGMQVQALDPTTRVPVSTSAISDVQGNFSLKVAPGVRTFQGNTPSPTPLATVLLVATSATMDNWQPRLEKPVDLSRGSPGNSLTVSLALPPLPKVAQLTYSVVGLGPSGKQVQVAGAHCQFIADVSDPKSEVRAFYEVAADTDANGKATVMLIPANDANRDYQVLVSPPSSSEFQATNTSVSVGPAGGYGAAIMLAQRSQVTGTVLGPDGNPVDNVMVTPYPATVAATLAPSQTAVMSKLANASTDASGSFVLRVDNGSYDLALVPSATGELPRQWLVGQVIGTDTQLSPVILPPSSFVDGQVADALGVPLVGADVRIFQISTHNLDCASQDYACLSPPHLIAEGQVDKMGVVHVLLPGSP